MEMEFEDRDKSPFIFYEWEQTEKGPVPKAPPPSEEDDDSFNSVPLGDDANVNVDDCSDDESDSSDDLPKIRVNTVPLIGNDAAAQTSEESSKTKKSKSGQIPNVFKLEHYKTIFSISFVKSVLLTYALMVCSFLMTKFGMFVLVCLAFLGFACPPIWPLIQCFVVIWVSVPPMFLTLSIMFCRSAYSNFTNSWVGWFLFKLINFFGLLFDPWGSVKSVSRQALRSTGRKAQKLITNAKATWDEAATWKKVTSAAVISSLVLYAIAHWRRNRVSLESKKKNIFEVIMDFLPKVVLVTASAGLVVGANMKQIKEVLSLVMTFFAYKRQVDYASKGEGYKLLYKFAEDNIERDSSFFSKLQKNSGGLILVKKWDYITSRHRRSVYYHGVSKAKLIEHEHGLIIKRMLKYGKFDNVRDNIDIVSVEELFDEAGLTFHLGANHIIVMHHESNEDVRKWVHFLKNSRNVLSDFVDEEGMFDENIVDRINNFIDLIKSKVSFKQVSIVLVVAIGIFILVGLSLYRKTVMGIIKGYAVVKEGKQKKNTKGKNIANKRAANYKMRQMQEDNEYRQLLKDHASEDRKRRLDELQDKRERVADSMENYLRRLSLLSQAGKMGTAEWDQATGNYDKANDLFKKFTKDIAYWYNEQGALTPADLSNNWRAKKKESPPKVDLPKEQPKEGTTEKLGKKVKQKVNKSVSVKKEATSFHPVIVTKPQSMHSYQLPIVQSANQLDRVGWATKICLGKKDELFLMTKRHILDMYPNFGILYEGKFIEVPKLNVIKQAVDRICIPLATDHELLRSVQGWKVINLNFYPGGEGTEISVRMPTYRNNDSVICAGTGTVCEDMIKFDGDTTGGDCGAIYWCSRTGIPLGDHEGSLTSEGVNYCARFRREDFSAILKN